MFKINTFIYLTIYVKKACRKQAGTYLTRFSHAIKGVRREVPLLLFDRLESNKYYFLNYLILV